MLVVRNFRSITLPCMSRSSAIASRCKSVSATEGTDRSELVIFDKNGTLVEFHDHWTPWITKYVERLEDKTNLVLKDRIYDRFDVCQYTGKIRSGLVGYGTSWEMKQEVKSVLMSMGVARSKAQWLADLCWQQTRPDGMYHASPLGDIKSLLKQLKEQNIQAALCTSDTRWRTISILDQLDVGEDLDFIMCGDDRGSVPKPNGHNITHICKELGVDPAKSYLIGDTAADMEMARAAGISRVIGVLSGVGNRLELSSLADCVLSDVTEAVENIVKGQLDNKNRSTDKAAVRDGKKASLVIFDKDGTLLCFHSLWTPWAEEVVGKLETKTGLDLREEILTAWGYCLEKQGWTSGIFAEGTMFQSQEAAVQVLVGRGIRQEEAEVMVIDCWDNRGTSKTLKIFDDPNNLFQILKDHGIKVAVCTADSRISTEQFLEKLGVASYVDAIVCGDDEESIPKPAATNALSICSTLNIDPAETIVIGDTIADLGMGRSAKLGATVAVLSGVGGVEDLDPLADHVVPSIKHVLSIALTDSAIQAIENRIQ